MTLDKMTLDKMTLDKLTLHKMTLDKMTPYREQHICFCRVRMSVNPWTNPIKNPTLVTRVIA